MNESVKEIINKSWLRYTAAVGGVILVIFSLEPFNREINSTTVSFALLLFILLVATFIGRNSALLSSLIAMLGFNYYFLPPVRTRTIADPQNLVAWAAFTVTAIIAGELSAYAKRRAEDATRGKQEIERLYHELQASFEIASQNEALRRSEKLKSALLVLLIPLLTSVWMASASSKAFQRSGAKKPCDEKRPPAYFAPFVCDASSSRRI